MANARPEKATPRSEVVDSKMNQLPRLFKPNLCDTEYLNRIVSFPTLSTYQKEVSERVRCTKAKTTTTLVLSVLSTFASKRPLSQYVAVLGLSS
ncbi:unnamed protein product [Caenorhabditis auriculariae]|uniref:Uncharacterized protein n=1 Tax=Caenorhabditis auriculariae TaxID=2777116 RepID=A0A8S1HB93_9PELO|nr:unnamed protein product [Caenorhabditis auriculariae]